MEVDRIQEVFKGIELNLIRFNGIWNLMVLNEIK